jgi:hypothetical protein
MRPFLALPLLLVLLAIPATNSAMDSTIVMVSARDFPGGSLERTMKSNMGGHKTSSTTKVTAYKRVPLVITGGTK